MVFTTRRPPSRKTVAARCAVAAVALVGVLVLVAAVARGPALEVRGNAPVPYDAGTVKEVRVLGSATVYVDGEPKPGPSVIGAIALIVLATAAFMSAAALALGHARRRLVTFYLLIAAGLGFAGLDELFAIHESTGHNLQFLAGIPGVARPDDVVIALYLVPMLAFAYVFRGIILDDRRAAIVLGIGAGCFALSAGADLAGSTVEEYLELAAGLCIAGGLAMMIYRHLRRNLRIHVEVVNRLATVEEPRRARTPAGTTRRSEPYGISSR